MESFLNGLGMGLSLIVAIGAQNAFVLVQGIRRNHHLAVGAVCALCDVVLISAGVLGVGAMVASSLFLRLLAGLGGGAFLLLFGAASLRKACTAHKLELNDSNGPTSLKSTLLTTLGLTFLNPHVYLDTVVMLGAISGNYPGEARYFFGAGACVASILWFFSLAQAGKLLAPVFARPEAWRVLHLLVCGLVWWIAWGLGKGAWRDLLELGGFA